MMQRPFIRLALYVIRSITLLLSIVSEVSSPFAHCLACPLLTPRRSLSAWIKHRIQTRLKIRKRTLPRRPDEDWSTRRARQRHACRIPSHSRRHRINAITAAGVPVCRLVVVPPPLRKVGQDRTTTRAGGRRALTPARRRFAHRSPAPWSINAASRSA